MSPMPHSMFVRLGLLLTGAWIATAGMPASAQQAYRGGGSYGTFACQSDDGRYRECRIDTRQPVRLVRQTSRSQCIEGQTWGVRPGIVWVDRGCRAEFALEDRGHDWERPSGRSGSVVCESPRDRHNRCPMDTRRSVENRAKIVPGTTVDGESGGVTTYHWDSGTPSGQFQTSTNYYNSCTGPG